MRLCFTQGYVKHGGTEGSTWQKQKNILAKIVEEQYSLRSRMVPWDPLTLVLLPTSLVLQRQTASTNLHRNPAPYKTTCDSRYDSGVRPPDVNHMSQGTPCSRWANLRRLEESVCLSLVWLMIGWTSVAITRLWTEILFYPYESSADYDFCNSLCWGNGKPWYALWVFDTSFIDDLLWLFQRGSLPTNSYSPEQVFPGG